MANTRYWLNAPYFFFLKFKGGIVKDITLVVNERELIELIDKTSGELQQKLINLARHSSTLDAKTQERVKDIVDAIDISMLEYDCFADMKRRYIANDIPPRGKVWAYGAAILRSKLNKRTIC